MKNKLQQLKDEIMSLLDNVKDGQVLKDVEVKYLGRKGELTQILRSLSELAEEEKKDIGLLANEIKKEVQEKFQQVKDVIAGKDVFDEVIDVTLPGVHLERGHLHLITQTQRELEDLFTSLGFAIWDGPELESDFYNFESLNIPPHHPARDMQDTFYIDTKNDDSEADLLLRTHTSPVQVRAMQKLGAPLRVIVPGRCFRCEATDVRHEHTFYQMEGLVIDKGINMSHLKGVLEELAKFLYGDKTEVRLRPKFYPFVEPGANIEVTCFLCHGAGCRLCKHSGWLEIGGSGLVHPNVLKAGGVDPDVYSGFAFGFGLNRLIQLKYGIEDGRLFMSGDLRFLSQF